MKLRLAELHYNLGHILHQQGDLAGAITAYQQAIGLDTSFAQAHHSLAVVLGERGQYEAAIAHYQQVIALQPDAVKAYNNLGCILVQRERLDEALQIYRQAIALQPNWAILHSNFGKAIAPEDPAAAIAAYRRAIELEPDLVSAHYNLGQAWLQQRQYQAAINSFQRLLGLDSAHPEAHTGCGLAFAALGELEQALEHFYAALLPQRAQIFAFCRWADRLQDNDELSLVRKACSQFLQAVLRVQSNLNQPPKEKSFHNSDCFAHCVTHSISPNIRHYLVQTYLHLANLLTRYGGTKQQRQAEFYYQQALRFQPDNLELYLRLGECLEKQQRWNAALFLYHSALTLYPNAVPLYQSLGQALEQQQRWMEAISYYRQALGLSRADLEHQSQPVETQFSQLAPSSKANVHAFTIERIKKIYLSTFDWSIQTKSSCYISLGSSSDNLCISKFIVCSNPAASNPGTFCNSNLNSTNESTCDGLNCHRCLKQITDQFAPIHLGQSVYVCQTLDLSVEPPPYFVAQILQAQAWMTPYQTPWMVANSIAILTADHALLADVSREYPGQLPGCQFHATFQRLFEQDAEVEQITGRVAALASLSGHNYFHWMVDVLPRFELLQRSGIDLTEVDWFWINQPQSAFQRETLQQLGIPAQKILAGDCHPRIQAEQLLVPSFAGHLGWLEPWALAFLRRQFLPLAASSSYERVYISRANAHHRRVLNEAAVLERLEPLGFVSVELESMSLAEQIALFAHAKVIIAPHGGGLTNLIFCQPETTVIEFFAPNYIRHYYWVISQQLHLRHFFILGEKFVCSPIHTLMYPSPLMEDIWINLEALNLALTELGLQ